MRYENDEEAALTPAKMAYHSSRFPSLPPKRDQINLSDSNTVLYILMYIDIMQCNESYPRTFLPSIRRKVRKDIKDHNTVQALAQP